MRGLRVFVHICPTPCIHTSIHATSIQLTITHTTSIHLTSRKPIHPCVRATSPCIRASTHPCAPAMHPCVTASRHPGHGPIRSQYPHIHTHTHSVSRCLCVSVSLCLCVSVSLYLCVSVSLWLCLNRLLACSLGRSLAGWREKERKRARERTERTYSLKETDFSHVQFQYLSCHI